MKNLRWGDPIRNPGGKIGGAASEDKSNPGVGRNIKKGSSSISKKKLKKPRRMKPGNTGALGKKKGKQVGEVRTGL